MMNSRGDPSPQTTALAQLTAAMAPSQVSMLAALHDLFELLQHSGPLLSAAVKDLRAAEEAARGAAADLEKTVADHTDRGVAHAARASELDQAARVLADREAACQEREAETARKQGAFDEMDAKLAVRWQALDRQTKVLAGDRAALDADKLRHAADHEAKAKTLSEEVERRRRESVAVVQALRDDAAADIREWRANAQAEMATKSQELGQREAKVAASEESFRSERARLSALLNQ